MLIGSAAPWEAMAAQVGFGYGTPKYVSPTPRNCAAGRVRIQVLELGLRAKHGKERKLRMLTGFRAKRLPAACTSSAGEHESSTMPKPLFILLGFFGARLAEASTNLPL